MKLAAGKGDPELLEQVRATFAAIPGIDEVKVNPDTGSLVLSYDPDHHDHIHGQFRAHLEEHHPETARHMDAPPPTDEIDEMARKIQDEAEFLAEHSHTAKVVVDVFKEVDRNIKLSTGNVVDLKIVLAAGVLGVTLLEVGATAATPIWLTFSVFGINHLVTVQHQTAPGAPQS